jgi:hypothetical protein
VTRLIIKPSAKRIKGEALSRFFDRPCPCSSVSALFVAKLALLSRQSILARLAIVKSEYFPGKKRVVPSTDHIHMATGEPIPIWYVSWHLGGVAAACEI